MSVSTPLDIPLMQNNITPEDRAAAIAFLQESDILTQSKNVRAFEQEWSEWLGVKYSVFLNSGSSANLATLSALKHLYGPGEIILPPLTWVSDVASVLHCGFKPVFVDIHPNTLAMDHREILRKITPATRAVFLTHILGLNGLAADLLAELNERKIPLIEDVCESHGATFARQKLGTFGLASNFSFYYAHHLSTVEGGMVCTNDLRFYETVRMLRGHGMTREMGSDDYKKAYQEAYPDLHPEFIFAYPAYNLRNTEINAVIGRSQLARLDQNNEKRRENFRLFISLLDPNIFRTDFDSEGSCNYALILVLKEKDPQLMARVCELLQSEKVEYRRGTSGGGNQLRQPYLRALMPPEEYLRFPEVEHIHFYGLYMGNYPDLSPEKIRRLCVILNSAGNLKGSRYVQNR